MNTFSLVAVFGVFLISTLTLPFDFSRNFWDRWIKGQKRVRIIGVGSAIEGTTWTATIWGKGPYYAFRYPGTRVGLCKLHQDGTGDYCGPIIWEYL